MESYGIIAILLLAFGLALIVAEVFIPSGGMIAIMALLCILASVWCAWNEWYKTDQVFWWWFYVAAVVVMIPGVIGGTFYVLPRTAMGRNLFANPPSEEEVTPFTEEDARLVGLINEYGETATRMMPGGLVLIGDERIHAESEGMMIPRGERVQIVGVKGNRLVVRAITEESETTQSEPLADASDIPPLDFDVQQT